MPGSGSDSARPNALTQAVLAYASQALRLFPVTPGDKTPRFGTAGDGWPVHATDEPVQLATWWSRWPDSNILVACGEGSGVVVLDFDVKGERPGEATAGALLGVDWKTRYRYTTTPSGGYHVWFRYDERTSLWGNRKLGAQGLDIQGEGAYVVVPPSTTPAGPYLDVNPHLPLVNVADEGLDARVRGLLGPSAVTRSTGEEAVPAWEEAALTEEALAALTARLPAKVQRALTQGDWSAWDEDRSAGLMGVCAALWGQRLNAATLVWVLMNNPHTYAVGSTGNRAGRAGSPESVAHWLWAYNALRSRPLTPGEAFGLPGSGGGGEAVGASVGAAAVSAPGAGPLVPVVGSEGDEDAAQVELLEAAKTAISLLGRMDVDGSLRVIRTCVQQGMRPLARGVVLAALKAQTGLGKADLSREWTRLEREQWGEPGPDPDVAELLKRYVFVEQADQLWDTYQRQWVSRAAFSHMRGKAAFVAFFGSEETEGLGTMVPCATYRPTNPWSPLYEEEETRMVPALGRSGEKLVNLWSPPDCEPLTVDIAPFGYDVEAAWREPLDLFWRLLDCMDFRPAEREHLLDFLAYTAQHPDEKIAHMMLLGGASGIGKDTLLEPLHYLLGEQNVAVTDGRMLESGFDPDLSHAKLWHIQELNLGAGVDARAAYNDLKPKLSNLPSLLPLNPKYGKHLRVPNIVNVVSSTNHEDAMAIEGDDRRVAMLWARGVKQSPRFYDELWTWLGDQRNPGKGIRLVAGYLLTRDVRGFNPLHPPPMTPWKEARVDDGMSPVASLLLDLIHRAQSERSGPLQWPCVSAPALQTAVEVARHSVAGLRERAVTSAQVGRAMAELALPMRRVNVSRHGLVDGGELHGRSRPKQRIYFLREVETYKRLSDGELLDTINTWEELSDAWS